MTHTTGGAAAGAAAAAAAIANAIKASGAIVNVRSDEFIKIVERAEKPLVVTAPRSFWSPGFKYLTPYRGLIFFTKSSEPLRLPGDVETILAQKIWVPS